MTTAQVIKRKLSSLIAAKALIFKTDFPSVIDGNFDVKGASACFVTVSSSFFKRHEASMFGGVVGRTSILPTRMASPISKNTSSTWCAASPLLCPVYGQGAFYL